MERVKPPLAARLLLVTLLGCFAALKENPVVRLQAELGLSPSPLERFFGIRGIFSGMTEASHQLVRLNFMESVHANILAGPLLASITVAILLWSHPRLTTRRSELIFFGVTIAGTVLNNLAPELLILRMAGR